MKFNTRDRRAGESIANYVAELRALGEYCDFGTTIKDMIRDRLVVVSITTGSNVVSFKIVT